MTQAKILIVEDKNIVSKDIQTRLTNLGYTVVGIVSSGVEAIKKTAETQPDLVLMDIVLKGDLNGIETAEQIRTRFNTAVVYLTAYSDDETLTRAKITEPFGYILKPFETKELQIAIEMALYKKKMENKLLESEKRLSTIINSMNDSIMRIDVDGTILQINKKTIEFVGKPESEIIGNHCWEIVHGTSEPYEGCPIVRMKKSLQRETMILTLNEKFFEIKLDPTFNNSGNLTGAVHIISDVTRSKKKEETLVKLNKAIQTSGEVVFLTDPEGIITYINPAFTATFGYTADEVIGKLTPRILKSGLMKPEDYEMFWKTVLSGQEVRAEYKNRTKDGKLIDIEGSASPVFDDKKNIIGFLGIQRDITERKRMDAELIKAKEKAEESDKLKSAFLANMSHEIRTPMNGILGFSELLKEPELSAEDRDKFIGIINRSSRQLLHIVSDIVDISKIEAGQETVHLAGFDLNKLMDDLFLVFHPQALQRQLKLIFRKEIPGGVFFIRSDAFKITQILNNLVGNAIKFTDEGEVGVECSLEPEQFVFKVKDTGIGIKKEIHGAIFDRFRQAELSTNRKYGGTGLGLSISKSYVEMLGGKIWLESTPGQGSTFIFTIPFVPAGAISPEKEQGKTISSSSLQALRGKTILIVEDEDDNAFFIREAIKTTGMKVIPVTNGLEATEQCKDHPEISLVLMDIKMQNMDGFEATRIIKSTRKDLPVIATTAYALSGDKEKCLAAGCDDYLSKPINRDKLTQMLVKYLG